MRLHHVISVLVLTGCAIDDFGTVGDPNTIATDGECTTKHCNSPTIDIYHFHELSSLGTPETQSGQSFHITDFLIRGDHYTAVVDSGKLAAVSPKRTLSGAMLVGGQLTITGTSKSYGVTIAAVNSKVPFWTTKAGFMETYTLNWTSTGNETILAKSICAGTIDDPYNFETDPHKLGNAIGAQDAVVFEADRIVTASRTLTIGEPSWFNIGCAGSSLFKLHATGHTEAAHKALPVDTTWQERQAMLKMFAADYCGNGAAFTVPGQKLAYKDIQFATLMDYDMKPPPMGIEARWNENGAACLDVPRVDQNPTADSLVYWKAPNTARAQAMAMCGARLPACGGLNTDVAGTQHALVITSN